MKQTFVTYTLKKYTINMSLPIKKKNKRQIFVTNTYKHKINIDYR